VGYRLGRWRKRAILSSVDVLRSFLSQIDHMEKDDLARAISRLAPLLADLDSGGGMVCQAAHKSIPGRYEHGLGRTRPPVSRQGT
jgi:hypothetical protein